MLYSPIFVHFYFEIRFWSQISIAVGGVPMSQVLVAKAAKQPQICAAASVQL
jgi:hypothetical protein